MVNCSWLILTALLVCTQLSLGWNTMGELVTSNCRRRNYTNNLRGKFQREKHARFNLITGIGQLRQTGRVLYNIDISSISLCTLCTTGERQTRWCVTSDDFPAKWCLYGHTNVPRVYTINDDTEAQKKVQETKHIQILFTLVMLVVSDCGRPPIVHGWCSAFDSVVQSFRESSTLVEGYFQPHVLYHVRRLNLNDKRLFNGVIFNVHYHSFQSG